MRVKLTDRGELRYGIRRSRNRSGFTLLEAVAASVILAIVLPGALVTIQWARWQSQSVSLEMIGQSLADSLMEMVKRSGYNEVAYGEDLPGLLDVGGSSSLLEFPRTPLDGGDDSTTLPDGAAGNASGPADYAYTSGLTPSGAVASNVNYLRFSPDQVAALNGYANAQAASAAGVTLLDSQFAWGVYIEEQTSPAMSNPVKLVVIVVKWKGNRGERQRFTTLRTLISSRTPRL